MERRRSSKNSRSSGCRDVLEVQEQEPEERVEEQMAHCQQPDGMPQEPAATSEQDVTSTGAGKANSISGMERPLPFLVCAST
jgi:hypothetical protein